MDDGGEPDTTLLARLAGPFDGRARAALSALYARHAPAVRGFLGRLGGAADGQREDWLHDTFLTAMRHASTFRAGSALPWLLALAARQVRDTRRAERRRAERESRAARESEARAAEPVAAAGGPELERHLAALPERQRLVLELRYVQGLGHQEVADVLGVSMRTAKGWAAAALEDLRARLGAAGEAHA